MSWTKPAQTQIKAQTPKPEKEGVCVVFEKECVILLYRMKSNRKAGTLYGICAYGRRNEKVR